MYDLGKQNYLDHLGCTDRFQPNLCELFASASGKKQQASYLDLGLLWGTFDTRLQLYLLVWKAPLDRHSSLGLPLLALHLSQLEFEFKSGWRMWTSLGSIYRTPFLFSSCSSILCPWVFSIPQILFFLFLADTLE